MNKLHIRSIETDEIVRSIEVSNPTTRRVERIVRGLLLKTDTERFYVDDSEFEAEQDEGGE